MVDQKDVYQDKFKELVLPIFEFIDQKGIDADKLR